MTFSRIPILCGFSASFESFLFGATGTLCSGWTTDLAFISLSYLHWPSNFLVPWNTLGYSFRTCSFERRCWGAFCYWQPSHCDATLWPSLYFVSFSIPELAKKLMNLQANKTLRNFFCIQLKAFFQDKEEQSDTTERDGLTTCRPKWTANSHQWTFSSKNDVMMFTN